MRLPFHREPQDGQVMDIVITHVDGDAPGYEALYRQLTGEFVPCQVRDLGELRFALRSIEKHASWANVVLVVQSEDHVPAWLDRGSVRIVQHEEFIPPELLPTFHWCTIAAHLHRIPGLSERFVSWHDDVLAGNPLQPGDLFAPDGLLASRWEKSRIPLKRSESDAAYQLNLKESRRSLCRMFGRKVDAFVYPHAPLPGTRKSWAEFYEAAMSDSSFRSTVTRRSRGDERKIPTIDPLVMYANWVELAARGWGRTVWPLRTIRRIFGRRRRIGGGKFAVVNDEGKMRRHMDGLRRTCAAASTGAEMQFLNVNDDAYDPWIRDGAQIDGEGINPVSVRLLHETLATLFPDRSRFERDEDASCTATERAVSETVTRRFDHPNLLLHPGRDVTLISTSHQDLEVFVRWGVMSQPATSFLLHYWPGDQRRVRVLASWERREERSVWTFKVDGGLPDHADAVFCFRFRARRISDAGLAFPVRARLCVQLASSGTLKDSVFVIGANGHYVHSADVADRRCMVAFEHRAELPGGNMEEAEFFLEFRLRLSSLGQADNGIEIEFLGQDTDAAPVGASP